MVRVKKSVRKIETSRASGLDVHATTWSRWRRLMSDQMCVEWTRAMGRIDMSVKNVLVAESERGLPSQEEIDMHMTIASDCNDNDIFEDEPLTKRFRDDHSLDRGVDAVSRRPWRQLSRVVGGRRVRLAKGNTVDSGAADNVLPRRLLRGKPRSGHRKPLGKASIMLQPMAPEFPIWARPCFRSGLARDNYSRGYSKSRR